MPRNIDWRAFLNRLTYCYGCGKFGLPRRGKPRPMGWKVLYQPHADAPAGLHVCTERCADDVRAAMASGPVTEPLKVGLPPMMDVDLRSRMQQELREEAAKRVAHERRFVFECRGCRREINPLSESGVPATFQCPSCNEPYQAELNGGELRIEAMLVPPSKENM